MLSQGGQGGGQKLPILRRHSLWTTPNLIIFDLCILKTFFLIRLLINATMANPIENDAVDRVERGSLKWKTNTVENISAYGKNFIVAQIKKLGQLSDGDRVTVSLRHSYFASFFGSQLNVR